jgi:hypothetical protein
MIDNAFVILGTSGASTFFLVFQGFPLNLKILGYMSPSDVRRSQLSPSGCIVFDQVRRHSEPLLGFGSKDE